MKIRNGFVSNSSSSSFVIYGRTYNEETLKKAFNIDEDDDDEIESLTEKLDEMDITWHSDYDGDWFVGHHLSEMNDDETLLQFKQRTEKELTEKFGNEKDDTSYSEFQIIDAVIGSSGELEWG